MQRYKQKCVYTQVDRYIEQIKSVYRQIDKKKNIYRYISAQTDIKIENCIQIEL